MRVLHHPGKPPTFRNYRASREGGSGAATKAQPCVTPGSPTSSQVVLKCCSTITEGEKHTHRHTHTPQNTFSISTHLCLTLSMAGRQAPTTSSFQGKAGGFLILPKAPWGHPLQLHTAWWRATGSPQTHRSVPKVLLYLDQGLGGCFSQTQIKRTGFLCYSYSLSSYSTSQTEMPGKKINKQNQAQSLQWISIWNIKKTPKA